MVAAYISKGDRGRQALNKGQGPRSMDQSKQDKTSEARQTKIPGGKGLKEPVLHRKVSTDELRHQ